MKAHRALLAACVLIFSGHTMAALPVRTFVASTGADVNDCSRSAPCRSFSAAIAATAAGGEVVVLDSAGYGPTTIDKSISLVSPSGIYAGVTSTVPEAIAINGGSFDVIVLRGLTIVGVGGSSRGIAFHSGRSLYVQHAVLRNFNDAAISFSSAVASYARIEGCTVMGGGYGVKFSGSMVKGLVIDSRSEDNSVAGISVNGAARVAVQHCVSAGNGTQGIETVGAGSDVTVDDSLLTENSAGIGAASSGRGRVSRTLIVNNTEGIFIGSSGILESFGDNHLANNGTDGSFLNTLALH
jgi:hypothetical protein